jgi:hypothetical protein
LGGFLFFFSEINAKQCLIKSNEKIAASSSSWKIKTMQNVKKTNRQHAYCTLHLNKFMKPDTFSYIIPLKRIGRLFVMEAVIDGQSGNLIFDTGATTLVLNRTYFREYVNQGSHTSAGITGSVAEEEKIKIGNLEIGTLKFKGLSAHLADLGHIENQRGIRVLGLFGFELIKSHEIIIDVVNNQIRLNPVDNHGNLLDTTKEFKADFTQKVIISNNIMIVKGMISNKPLWFCFDSGAETNALSSDLSKAVLQTVSITRTLKLRGAGSFSNEVFYGRMNQFQYGDSLYNRMETIITYLDHLKEAYGIQIDGVLGFGFISSGSFCINFVKKQMGISYLRQALP